MLKLACLWVTILLSGIRVQAEILYSPVSVETTLGEYPPSTPGPSNKVIREWKMTNLFNQSGMIVPFKSGNVGTNFFLRPRWQLSTNEAATVWRSRSLTNQPLPGFLDFDFGTSLEVEQIYLWNWSLKEVSLFLRSMPSEAWQPAGQMTLNLEQPPQLPRPTIRRLETAMPARYLRVQINSVHPWALGSQPEFAILGEVMVSARGELQPTVWTDRNADGSVWVGWTGIPQSSRELGGVYQDAFVSPATGSIIVSSRYFLDRYLIPAEFTLERVFYRAE